MTHVNAVTFSPDGKQLATASDDNTARLWDAATGKELQRLSHDGHCYAVTFSPDGKQLATASDGQDCAAVGYGDRQGTSAPEP